MQTLDQANKRALDPRLARPSKDPNDHNGFRIYWLAYLLTGHGEPSLEVAKEALDLQLDFQDNANPFFSTWILAWSRRVFIAKALAAIRDELAESARRTASKRAENTALPPRNWTLDRDTTKIQLRERAPCHRCVSTMRSSAVGLRRDAAGGCGDPAKWRSGPGSEGPDDWFARVDPQPRPDAGVDVYRYQCRGSHE